MAVRPVGCRDGRGRPDEGGDGHTYGAAFVEVRVHPRYGRVRVTRVVGAYDAGRILNPQTASGSTALGAKGFGETPITGVISAIGNAIFHATGRRLRELPFTKDKLLL